MNHLATGDPDSGSPPQALDAAEPTREYLTFRLGDEEYGVDILKVQEILTETQLVHPYIGISLYHHPFAKPLVKAAFGTFVSGCSHELFEYDRRAQPPSSQPSEPQPLNLSELSVRLNRPRNQPKTALTHSPTP